MKLKSVLLVAFVMGVGSGATVLAADTNPKLVTMHAENVFAPPGFNTNNNVQLVVTGNLPNTCYKSAPPIVKVDTAAHKIYVQTVAYLYNPPLCLELWTPFTRVVDLGVLPQGSYQVIGTEADGSQKLRATLPVAVARTAAPDEFLYAPIAHATVDRSTGKAVLSLDGVFSSDCVSLQQVKVMYRVPHIVEVLPISSFRGGKCDPRPTPFETQVDLPAVDPGSTLIYVRSLNGQALSLVEDLGN